MKNLFVLALTLSLAALDTQAQTINLATQVRGVLSTAHGGAGTTSGALKGNGAGVVTQAACGDLSNAAASCATDATNATNITSGTLPAARLSAVPNSALTNSTVTIGSTSVALGGTAAIVAGLALTNPVVTVQALSDAATIAWNMNSGNVATVTVATAGRAMGAPTNLPSSGSAALKITYSGAGTITSFNAVYKWASGTAPTLTNSTGKIDMITCNIFDGTNLLCATLLDVR